MAAYCTVADVRAEGYDETEYPDPRVTAMIGIASMLIDQECQRWFDERSETFTLYGDGSPILDLPHCPISITSVTVSEPGLDDVLLESDEYEIMQDGEDWRRMPRLKYLIGAWPSGLKIVIVGSFGFVNDPANAKETPSEIVRLCTMWAGSLLPTLAAVGIGSDEIESEQLADYKYKLRSQTEGSSSSSDIRSNAEARAIIDAFTNYEAI
jgi:hypothetical protein